MVRVLIREARAVRRDKGARPNSVCIFLEKVTSKDNLQDEFPSHVVGELKGKALPSASATESFPELH